jgi:hypothetical protein
MLGHPTYGLAVKLTHLGTVNAPIAIDDIRDAIPDVFGDTGFPSFEKAVQVYVPFNSNVTILYTSNVARSFENGAIRKFIELGDLRAEFIIGSAVIDALNSIIRKGRVIFEDDHDAMAVVFTVPYPDTDYYLSFGTLEITVGVANVNTYYSNKTPTGFVVHISAPPGIGNSVAVEWTCFHS